jgi:murein DD-endopeptidase MepM/ murein hydrolase activator NlpD
MGAGRRRATLPVPWPSGTARWLVLVLLLVGAGCSLPRWPAEGTVSSPFGIRWGSVLPTVHRGVDVAMPTGTPVRAMTGGRVRFAGQMRGYGNVVWLDHRRGMMSVYAHLDEIHVSTGETVRHRQVLGLSGQTGHATGPHLHFEVWVAGRPVDPVPFLGGRP